MSTATAQHIAQQAIADIHTAIEHVGRLVDATPTCSYERVAAVQAKVFLTTVSNALVREFFPELTTAAADGEQSDAPARGVSLALTVCESFASTAQMKPINLKDSLPQAFDIEVVSAKDSAPRTATALRREWMTLYGLSPEEIDTQCANPEELSVAEEEEQLAAERELRGIRDASND